MSPRPYSSSTLRRPSGHSTCRSRPRLRARLLLPEARQPYPPPKRRYPGPVPGHECSSQSSGPVSTYRILSFRTLRISSGCPLIDLSAAATAQPCCPRDRRPTRTCRIQTLRPCLRLARPRPETLQSRREDLRLDS